MSDQWHHLCHARDNSHVKRTSSRWIPTNMIFEPQITGLQWRQNDGCAITELAVLASVECTHTLSTMTTLATLLGEHIDYTHPAMTAWRRRYNCSVCDVCSDQTHQWQFDFDKLDFLGRLQIRCGHVTYRDEGGRPCIVGVDRQTQRNSTFVEVRDFICAQTLLKDVYVSIVTSADWRHVTWTSAESAGADPVRIGPS